MTKSEGFAMTMEKLAMTMERFTMTERMGFLPLNEHGHDYMDIVVHADRTDDAGT